MKRSAQVDLQRIRFTERVSVMEYSSVPFLKIVHPLHGRDKLQTFSLAGTNPPSQTLLVIIPKFILRLVQHILYELQS